MSVQECTGRARVKSGVAGGGEVGVCMDLAIPHNYTCFGGVLQTSLKTTQAWTRQQKTQLYSIGGVVYDNPEIPANTRSTVSNEQEVDKTGQGQVRLPFCSLAR